MDTNVNLRLNHLSIYFVSISGHFIKYKIPFCCYTKVLNWKHVTCIIAIKKQITPDVLYVCKTGTPRKYILIDYYLITVLIDRPASFLPLALLRDMIFLQKQAKLWMHIITVGCWISFCVFIATIGIDYSYVSRA